MISIILFIFLFFTKPKDFFGYVILKKPKKNIYIAVSLYIIAYALAVFMIPNYHAKAIPISFVSSQYIAFLLSLVGEFLVLLYLATFIFILSKLLKVENDLLSIVLCVLSLKIIDIPFLFCKSILYYLNYSNYIDILGWVQLAFFLFYLYKILRVNLKRSPVISLVVQFFCLVFLIGFVIFLRTQFYANHSVNNKFVREDKIILYGNKCYLTESTIFWELKKMDYRKVNENIEHLESIIYDYYSAALNENLYININQPLNRLLDARNVESIVKRTNDILVSEANNIIIKELKINISECAER